MNAFGLLSDHPVTVEPTTRINEAVDRMESFQIRHLPVLQERKLVGILSDRDILLLLGQSRGIYLRPDMGPPATRVEQIMSAPVRSITPGLALDEIVEFLIAHRFSALPVLLNEDLVGIITKTDVLRWYHRFCRNHPDNPAAGETVRPGMQHNVLSLTIESTVQEAYMEMILSRVQHVPIMADRKLVGMVSDRDIRRVLGRSALGADADDAPGGRVDVSMQLGTIMSTGPVTIGPDHTMDEAAALMIEHRINALPVVSNGILTGIVTSTDVLRAVRGLVVGVPA
jgi:CBS domain-containing protein